MAISSSKRTEVYPLADDTFYRLEKRNGTISFVGQPDRVDYTDGLLSWDGTIIQETMEEWELLSDVIGSIPLYDDAREAAEPLLAHLGLVREYTVPSFRETRYLRQEGVLRDLYERGQLKWSTQRQYGDGDGSTQRRGKVALDFALTDLRRFVRSAQPSAGQDLDLERNGLTVTLSEESHAFYREMMDALEEQGLSF